MRAGLLASCKQFNKSIKCTAASERDPGMLETSTSNIRHLLFSELVAKSGLEMNDFHKGAVKEVILHF